MMSILQKISPDACAQAIRGTVVREGSQVLMTRRL